MKSIAQIVSEQHLYFNTNNTKSISFRKEQLKKLKSLLQLNEPLLYKAIYADFKKSEFETFVTELALVYHEIDTAIKNLNKWSRKQRVRTNIINIPGRSYMHPEPLGVCLVIGAWNYPIQLSLAPFVGALAAGNTVILKPSEITSNTSGLLAKIINTNFPNNYLYVQEGGVLETTTLLEQKVNHIFFTGSTFVGKIVYQAAAKNLTPVTLELGGKSPAIISQHCNLKMTAKRLVWAKFLNAGQTCIAPDYVVIHESIKQSFIELCSQEIEKAQYRFENHNYVQIISDNHFNRLSKFLKEGTIALGGNTDAATRYISPTLITDIDFNSHIMNEEIFGPILPIISYHELDDAITAIKTKDKPLSCYVFTEKKLEKEKVINEISFGGGAINDGVMHITNPHLPFGGIGGSGIGSYHGKHSFKTFSHYKSIISKPTWFEFPFKFYPLSLKKLKIIKFLMKF